LNNRTKRVNQSKKCLHAFSNLPLTSIPEGYVHVATALTDAAGNYEFENLEDGVYIVIVEIDDYASTPSKPITLADGATAGNINFTVKGDTIFPEGGIVHTQQITNADETIRLEHLPAGVYFFTIEKDGKTKTVKVIKN
jgi:hypothetical protein